MKKEKLKKVLPYVLLLLVVVIGAGLTYAIYRLTDTGNQNSITTGQISMSYVESSNVINISDVLPIQDEEGYKEDNEYFDFSVTSNLTLSSSDPDAEIYYEITLEPLSVDSGYNALNNNQVKVYLTTLDSGTETSSVESLISSLSDSTYGTGNKILYSASHTHTYGTNIVMTNYRLRTYIPYEVDASDWSATNKYQYKFRVNVNGGAKILYKTPEYCFTYTNNGTSATITDYLCYLGNKKGYDAITDVLIPNTLGGYNVTTIGDYAFDHNELTSVTIPNSVTKIGRYAFWGDHLTSVVIPDSVTTIESNVFYENQLTSIIIPESVTSIWSSSFAGNPNLTSIVVDSNNTVYDSRNNSNAIIITSSNELIQGCKNTIIPNTVTSIWNHAFDHNGLTSVTIPSSVTSIGVEAFRGNNLTSITIPRSVTTIEDRAFITNPLTSIVVDSNNTVYDSRNNSNAIIKTSTNELIQGCKNTIIPSTVTTIGDYAFYDNQLTSVVIPDSVTTIEDFAFFNSHLTSVVIPNSVTSIGDEAFSYNQLTSVVIPNSVITIGQRAFYESQINNLTIGNSVTTIGDSAFSFNLLSSVVIPNSVTSIGGEAFSVNQINNLTIGNSVTTIGYQAFSINELTSITLPSSVTSIGDEAFAVNSLTAVRIKGKSSSDDFEYYGSDIWGWNNYDDSNITWNYVG